MKLPQICLKEFFFIEETNPNASVLFDICYGFPSPLLLWYYHVFRAIEFLNALKHHKVKCFLNIVVIWLFSFSSLFLFSSNTDDIILLKNIGDSSTEEEKDKIEDDIKSKADSKEQSDAHEYYWKRGKVY